jgi:hypothetical protein
MGDRAGDWMITYSGRRFWPLDPRPDDVSWVDIAHALSLSCRYGGHAQRFYSVAEHSVLLARYFGRLGQPLLSRYALLHDGAEAYVADVIRPIKRQLPAFRRIEAPIEAQILVLVGLDPEIPAAVAEADSAIVADEATALFGAERIEATGWRLPAPLGVPIECWPAHYAEIQWAATFRALFPAVVWQ